MANERDKAPEKKNLKGAAKPGAPKSAHRDFVSGGKNLNKDTRREMREKH